MQHHVHYIFQRALITAHGNLIGFDSRFIGAVDPRREINKYIYIGKHRIVKLD